MSQNMMSVSSLNTKIKSLLEATFMHTMVEGEVASATYHTSGHLYFSIKDKDSSVKCVMWRSSVAKMKFRIEKGMHIVVEGSVSVYTPRGEYQFQTVRIEPYGQGALALAFEQLKEKLKGKGYFDAQRKKEIPKHIQKIALVTAKDSAALHDMLKIIETRWAMVEVTIVDTLVQGEHAATQIAKALRYADTIGMDVVILGRGGGSAEDLWSFNEEIVADAMYVMKTPVVSCVGHEVDVMISDFVADLRAPTPSAAIEMVLSDSKELLYLLDELNGRISYAMKQKIQKLTQELQYAQEILQRTSPAQKLVETNQRFKQHIGEFKRIIEYKIEQFSSKPSLLSSRLNQAISLRLRDNQHFLELLSEKFTLNNPTLKCHNGWAQVSYEGKVVGLSDIEIGKKFILEDEKVHLEVLCIDKKVFNG